MQAADQVLQEQLERLRQADQLTAVDVERGDADSAVVDQSTCVVLRVAGDRRRGVAHGRHAAAAGVRATERRHLLGAGRLVVLVE